MPWLNHPYEASSEIFTHPTLKSTEIISEHAKHASMQADDGRMWGNASLTVPLVPCSWQRSLRTLRAASHCR